MLSNQEVNQEEKKLTNQNQFACPEILAQWRQGAEQAALLGAYQLEWWRRKFQVKEKGRADLVTEADFASQRAIRQYLLHQFPDHAFLGEEDVDARMDRSAGLPSDHPPTWIVDPLDGTLNYVHDCPMYCVSIGLLVQNKLQIGVVYDPRQKEMFSAARGQGATLNGERIRASSVIQLSDALVSTGFPSDLEAQKRNWQWWQTFSLHVQALRRTGSTALNLAYVAAGRFDAYWSFDNYAWDVAGGIVLIEEADGVVTDCQGGIVNPFRPDILAATSHVHHSLKLILQGNPLPIGID